MLDVWSSLAGRGRDTLWQLWPASPHPSPPDKLSNVKLSLWLRRVHVSQKPVAQELGKENTDQWGFRTRLFSTRTLTYHRGGGWACNGRHWPCVWWQMSLAMVVAVILFTYLYSRSFYPQPKFSGFRYRSFKRHRHWDVGMELITFIPFPFRPPRNYPDANHICFVK